jgi:hypothetical protein
MKELCGFSTDFWPGEDTKLCLDITKKLGKKIVYDPSVLVYHHRRPLFKGHLNQVANYALHRGYFAKVYPETSLKIAYFVPSLFVVFLFFGASASLLSPLLRKAYFICLLSYLAVILLCSASRDLRLTLLVALGTLATHFTYGVYFMKGLLSRRLKEEG